MSVVRRVSFVDSAEIGVGRLETVKKVCVCVCVCVCVSILSVFGIYILSVRQSELDQQQCH